MINEILKLEIQTICIVHIISIILATILLMVFYYKAYNEKSIKYFIVVQLSMIFWMIFKIFKTVSPNIEIRWSFIVAYYVCVCILEVSFLEFSYVYNKGEKIKKSIRIAIYALSVVQAIIIISNPIHHLFYSYYDFWKDSFGILFYVHTMIVYIFISIGFVYCYKTFQKRFQNKNKLIRYLVSGAILIPLIINILYITKKVHIFVSLIGIPVIFDITPIIFSWSLLVFVYATFNNKFFDTSPFLRHELVLKLNTPIIVLDSGYKSIFLNEKVKEIFNDNLELLLEKIKMAVKNNKIGRTEILDRILNVNIKKVYDVEETHYIVTFYDISEYVKLEEELYISRKNVENSNESLERAIKKQEELSKEGAKNYIARELHDIVGHSLVVTTKLLEVAKLYKKDENLTKQAIEDAYKSLDEGISKMNNLTKEKLDDYTGLILKKQLEKILRYPKEIGLETKLILRGESIVIESKIYDIILKIISELITNTLKHSKAKEIFINVGISEKEIRILYMDNGVGCDNLKKGNGLKGIENRIAEIEGTVIYDSKLNNGFMSKIII